MILQNEVTLNNVRGSRRAKVGCKRSAESSKNLNTEGIEIGKIYQKVKSTGLGLEKSSPSILQGVLRRRKRSIIDRNFTVPDFLDSHNTT